ncbi:hypothetical protein FKW77_007433 [Venturia effusa]|uniref:Uncharacterized protein n=1 Tax=Venturia effusa TaxID=50376 RepID=A0A517LKI5_9PEZI|nr:hypothetical protein FKW77_007433 [Venturia effusa]
MSNHPTEPTPTTQSDQTWNIPSSDEAFNHPSPLPNPSRTATIISNATNHWGPGDWHVEAGFYFKPSTHNSAKCISLVGIWDHTNTSPDGDWHLGFSCAGPGVLVHTRMCEADVNAAIRLSLDVAVQKLEYITDFEERGREEEAAREVLRLRYERSERRGAVASERGRRRERNDILRDRLVLHWNVLEKTDYNIGFPLLVTSTTQQQRTRQLKAHIVMGGMALKVPRSAKNIWSSSERQMYGGRRNLISWDRYTLDDNAVTGYNERVSNLCKIIWGPSSHYYLDPWSFSINQVQAITIRREFHVPQVNSWARIVHGPPLLTTGPWTILEQAYEELGFMLVKLVQQKHGQVKCKL